MIIKILADGGAMKPGPALSQKLGPAGINMNSVITKVNEATKDFAGMKVPVELNVNSETKDFQVQVFSPPASELLKKEFKVEKGSGQQKNVQVANASIEQIIAIAKTKMPNLLCKDLKSAVKTISGTCVSLGILIENKPAVEVEQEIAEGKYDNEINAQQTETPDEKKQELGDYFSKIKVEQDKLLKQQEQAKQVEEEKKAKAATKAPPAKK